MKGVFNINNYTILSLDQATATGWAVANKGQIVHYGLLSSEKDDYDYKIIDLKVQISALIDTFNPVLTTIEEVHYNPKVGTLVFKKLCKLQGVLINYFIENDMLYEVIKPSQWQSNEGFKGKNKKKQSLDKGIEFTNNPELDGNSADAIWMCKYAVEKINVIESEGE